MQRVFYLVLFLSVGMVLLAISKNSPVQSQELPRITELSDSDELFLNSLEEEDVDDFAPDVDGYLLPSRGWVENLVENRAVLAFERPGVLEYVEPR
ncbi:MAG: hypothetical protein KDA65_09070, partial [Planctomycetaceae bacterium]|nr:hypothetical protein [Planctomycetaceae bacterium]